MELAWVDWLFILGFFAVSLVIGLLVTKKAGSSSAEFFLSGRNMPWWLLGVSMVATTFSADTPNLVTNLVRTGGVAGNWVWWAFLLTGMLTVFVYAKLWRRSGVMTDLEFYELRYSGRGAAFLRGFRALYLGVLFNVIVMGIVGLAAVKMGGIMFDLPPWKTLLFATVVTMIYSSLGGLRGVLLTDFIQFGIAMVGSVWAALYLVNRPEVGGLSVLLAHENVRGQLSIVPPMLVDGGFNPQVMTLLMVPFAVQWWAAWYPGSEPGGGGYIAQRMLSARNERHAMGATLFFNAAHYALRPWPWILVGLASLVVFPQLEDIQRAFPGISDDKLGHDLGYPAMLTMLPAGLLGLVVASLMAAFMSTISTHLNWGSSYVVHDFYRRFVNPEASEKRLVFMGRLSTVLMSVAACAVALGLRSAEQAFHLVLMMGAGTGLIYILRWFWWRINPASEITAMVVSFVVSFGFTFVADPLLSEVAWWSWVKFPLTVLLVTAAWLAATFLTPPSDSATLRAFVCLVHPGGPGWRKVVDEARAEGDDLTQDEGGWDLPQGILCMVIGCFAVYGALFATGYWIYGRTTAASVMTVVSVAATFGLFHYWNRLRAR